MFDVGRVPGIRPLPSMRRRLDALARRGFPFLCTVTLMFVANAPLGIPRQSALLPAITVISVFFWSVYRPASLPPPVVCLVGLLFDLLGWLPLGVGTIALLAIHALALRWRRHLARQGFALTWIGFTGFGAAAALLIWAGASVLDLRMLPLETALFQAALTAALYPVIAIPLTRAHHTIANPELA